MIHQRAPCSTTPKTKKKHHQNTHISFPTRQPKFLLLLLLLPPSLQSSLLLCLQTSGYPPNNTMQQHPLQSHMGFYPPHNVTTEIVQKCLDENKQLILAILDNQSLGKLNDCAAYRARLQSNLMYLAAVADSQPQPQAFHAQVAPTVVLPPGSHYMLHSQAQQQMAQHSFMVARNPLEYTQHQVASIHETQQHQHQQFHQQQQALHGMHGLNSGGNNGHQMVSPEFGMAGSSSFHSGSFPDFGRGGNIADGLQFSRGSGREVPGTKPDVMVLSNIGHSGPGVGHLSSGVVKNADNAEPLYLKASEGNGS